MHDSTTSVGYVRVSRTDQKAINQVDELRKHGVTVIFSDEGVSGSKPAMSRPEYREMIRHLDTHPLVKTIVVYELSRIGRDMLDSINTFIGLERRGYMIWSISESWTHTQDPNMRTFMVSIVSWLNEQELKRDSKRIKLGMESARVHGTRSGKPIGKPAKIPDKETVGLLRKEKKSWGEIAGIFHMDVSTLYRYRRNWKRDELGRGTK